MFLWHPRAVPLVAKWFEQMGNIKGLVPILILSLTPDNMQVKARKFLQGQRDMK